MRVSRGCLAPALGLRCMLKACMRCTGWSMEELPPHLRAQCTYVRMGDPDGLAAGVAALLEAAQTNGLMEHVDNKHCFYVLNRGAFKHVDHCGLVQQAGCAVAAADPGSIYKGTRLQVYDGTGTGMAAHRDIDSMHSSFPHP